jgi:hypothetical protein
MLFSAQKLKQESSSRFYRANLILNLNPGLASLKVLKIWSIICLLVIQERDTVLTKFSVSLPHLSRLVMCRYLCSHSTLDMLFVSSSWALCMSGHPWITDSAVAPDKPIDSAVLSRLKHFSAMNKLKKMALRVYLL